MCRRFKTKDYWPIRRVIGEREYLGVALANTVELRPRNAFRIRPSETAELDAVSAVLSASYSKLLVGSYDADALAMALPKMSTANPRLLDCGTHYVAEMPARRIAGCGGWTRGQPGTGTIAEGAGHIRHFAGDPSFARQGLGSALVERCIAEPVDHGVHTLECFSTLSAEAFFASVGFRTIGRIEVAFPNGIAFPSLHLRRMNKPRN